jgi:acyl-CoA thioester hydrolase
MDYQDPMTARYSIRLTVPFYDVDPMQVVWHGHYLKYFDRVRFGLFTNAGIDMVRYMQTHNMVFPITRSSIKHIAPLRVNDVFFCEAAVIDASYKITMAFEVRRERDDIVCARGRSEQVAVTLPEMELAFEIPRDIRRALGILQ